jgi:hypothetical protein
VTLPVATASLPHTVPTIDGVNGLGSAASPVSIAFTGSADSQQPAITAIVDGRHVHYEGPIAADLVTIVAAANAALGACSIAAQPDFPRKLQVRIVDANGSISAGILTLVGVGARGQAVTQAIPLTGGTQTVTTADAYATLTSATITALVGAAAGDTVGIGPANDLGLPGPKSLTPSLFAVYKSCADNANETVGTVDATAGTIAPTTAPNGSHRYDFWFNFSYQPVQAAHTHAVAPTVTP